MLHRTNDTPATPIGIVQTWGTDKQVSAFIEDIWPINWTRDAFDHYIRPTPAEAHSHLVTPADKNALVATAELLAKEKAIAAEAEGGAS